MATQPFGPVQSLKGYSLLLSLLIAVLLVHFEKIVAMQAIPITFIGFGIGIAISQFLGPDIDERKLEDAVKTWTDTWKVKSDLGLQDDPAKLVKNHVSSFKYFEFYLLVCRFCINVKALCGNFANLWTKELPASLGNAAQAVEGGFFVVLSLTFLLSLANAVLGNKACRWACVEQFKNLAGFSSLRLLAFVNVSHLSKLWTKLTTIATDAHTFNKVNYHITITTYAILLPVITITYASLGMAVLIGKLSSFDIKSMESMGLYGMCVEFGLAVWAGNFGTLMELGFVKLAIFANQVVSFNSAKKLEFERLLKYIFARGDSKLDGKEVNMMNHFKEMLAAKLALLPNWRSRLVATMTFGPDDLQKLTIEDIGIEYDDPRQRFFE